MALGAATGRPCSSFGRGGAVSLLEGMGDVPDQYFFITSAPTIVRGIFVLGGFVADNQRVGEPSGVIRGFDAVTGKFAWAFDAGHPERQTAPPPGESYTRGTPNSWAPMSGDEALGLVYALTGGATPDYYGGQRRPFDERYSGSVIAIDVRTGKPRWTFQAVHHDLWDYDVASQPTLVDVPDGKGGVQKLLVLPTKRPVVPARSRHRQSRRLDRGAKGSGRRRGWRAPFAYTTLLCGNAVTRRPCAFGAHDVGHHSLRPVMVQNPVPFGALRRPVHAAELRTE